MLRVMTWNIDHGKYHKENQLQRIEQVVKASEANVVALQEAPNWKELQSFRQALEMDWHFAAVKDNFSLALLCSGQAVNGSTYDKVPGPRPVVRLAVPFEGSQIDVFTLHLKHGRRQNAEQHRLDEIQAVLQILKTFSGRPHLLAGDFNALAPNDRVGVGRLSAEDEEDQPQPNWATQVGKLAIARMLEAGYIDCFRDRHPDAQADPGYTFSTTSPWLRFDYIFASKELAGRLKSCKVFDSPAVRAACDHFPVIAEFD